MGDDTDAPAPGTARQHSAAAFGAARYHQEQPDTRVERYLCLAGMALAFLAGDQLVLRIVREPAVPHTLHFLGLGLLLWLSLYLLWLLVTLRTVRYAFSGDELILRQGWRRLAIPLGEGIQLCRWRNRWAWAGAAERDLGVSEVELFPPLWFGRSHSVWVVRYPGPDGERRAAAFHPSPELLVLLKMAREREGMAG